MSGSPERGATEPWSTRRSNPPRSARRRVLFFGEPATLAHVVRPLVLGRSMDPSRYDVHFATGPDFRDFVVREGLTCHSLWAIGSRAYLEAVAKGRPVFSLATLRKYVADDLRLIAEVKPDLVVGDFRLSLAVSARIAQVPYFAISNAYWSPHSATPFEVPAHMSTRLLGVKTAGAIFRLLSPLIMAQHSMPMHRLRTEHGMASLGFDLRRVFTEADVTLFADVPDLVPTNGAIDEGRYAHIGPITWSPPMPMPPGLSQEGHRSPLIYVNMGSSGDAACTQSIVDACAGMDCRLAVATGKGAPLRESNAPLVSAPILPGRKLSVLAALVICNGGSPSTHQALQAGTPVLGIPANLDQLMNMQCVERSGSGASLRADRLSKSRLRRSIERILQDRTYVEQAARVARSLNTYSATKQFAAVVDRHLGRARGEARPVQVSPYRVSAGP